MEESLNQSDNDAESQKLLYKYQYAFLHMQKSFTSLFKIIRLYESQVKFRYLVRWKTSTFNQVFKLKIYIFRLRLKSCESKFKKTLRLNMQKTFNFIMKASNYSKYLNSLKNKYKKVQENNLRELGVMEKEMINLKKSQVELEHITKSYNKREIGYKMKLDLFGGRNLLEKLRSENKQLKNEIFEIDKKTFAFFKDMNLIIDELEELKKRKMKKNRKKTKVVIKGRQMLIGQV